jgi:hypothetical protein
MTDTDPSAAAATDSDRRIGPHSDARTTWRSSDSDTWSAYLCDSDSDWWPLILPPPPRATYWV